MKNPECLIQGQGQEGNWRKRLYGGMRAGLGQRCSHEQLKERNKMYTTLIIGKKKRGLKKTNCSSGTRLAISKSAYMTHISYITRYIYCCP